MTTTDIRYRMPNDELLSWIAYVEENGPVNPMLRVDAAIARAVAPFIKDAKPKDFMVWPKEPEQPTTPESVFAMFKNLATKTNSRKH